MISFSSFFSSYSLFASSSSSSSSSVSTSSSSSSGSASSSLSSSSVSSASSSSVSTSSSSSSGSASSSLSSSSVSSASPSSSVSRSSESASSSLSSSSVSSASSSSVSSASSSFEFERKALYDWIQIPPLCQLCVDYLKSPPPQLWLFPHKESKLARFDPQTSEIEIYPGDQKLAYHNFFPKILSPWSSLDCGPEFLWSTGKTLECGTLREGRVEIESKPTMAEFPGSVDFLFAFQNQLYVLGDQSRVWKNFQEVKAIPALNGTWWGVAWIVHDEHVYRFGGNCQPTDIAKRFSLLTQEWTQLPCLKSFRKYSSAALHLESKQIFVSGGKSHKDHHDDIEFFNIRTQRFVWRKKNVRMPKPLWDHFSFCFHGFYFLVGGFCKLQKNQEIWKHQLTDDGKFVGKWQHVTSFPFQVFQNGMTFG